MDFKKTVKLRMTLYGVYCLIGATMIFAGDKMCLYFGIGFIAVSLIKLVRYAGILWDESAMEKMHIAENDERNVMLCTKARSAAFSIFAMLSGVAVVVLFAAGKSHMGQTVALCLCAYLVIYCVCYGILAKRY